MKNPHKSTDYADFFIIILKQQYLIVSHEMNNGSGKSVGEGEFYNSPYAVLVVFDRELLFFGIGFRAVYIGTVVVVFDRK